MDGLVFNEPSFEEAMGFHDALLQKAGQDGQAIHDLFNGKVNVQSKVLADVLSSSEIREKLFVCARRSTYKGKPVTPEIFDSAKMWGVYYMIMIEIGKQIMVPFFAGLSGGLSESEGVPTEIPGVK